MKIKVFLETAGNFDEREILTKFYQGLKDTCGREHDVHIDIEKSYSPCDVSIMLGSWKPRDKDHHIVRTSVADNSKSFVVIETPLLNRSVFEKNKNFRIGVNGFLNNSGLFNYGNHNSSRLQKLGITWNGWKDNPHGHILLMLQLPGDASLRGANIYEWMKHAVCQIREKTDKKIVIRTHPAHNMKDGDDFYKIITEFFTNNVPNISISNGKVTKLEEDLCNAYCTVCYSSGSSIDSIVYGIPTIAYDPGNFAYEISSNYFEDILNLKKAAPQQISQWLNNLAYSQWSIAEMSDGTVWHHIFPFIEKTLSENPPKKKK